MRTVAGEGFTQHEPRRERRRCAPRDALETLHEIEPDQSGGGAGVGGTGGTLSGSADGAGIVGSSPGGGAGGSSPGGVPGGIPGSPPGGGRVGPSLAGGSLSTSDFFSVSGGALKWLFAGEYIRE